MEKEILSHSDYVREIAKILAKLPLERAAEVYDFARFLLAPRPLDLPISDEDDWLYDSPELIAQEDSAWKASFELNQEKTSALTSDARKEYELGQTTALFNDKGELNLP
jgi:hypothetical protein